LIERSNAVVPPCTAVRRSMERARKHAVRKKRSKSRGQTRMVRVLFRLARQQHPASPAWTAAAAAQTGSEEPGCWLCPTAVSADAAAAALVLATSERLAISERVEPSPGALAGGVLGIRANGGPPDAASTARPDINAGPEAESLARVWTVRFGSWKLPVWGWTRPGF
jgi:hypothetical protein